MMEDYLYSFVPETRKDDGGRTSHRRRESLLKQPNEGSSSMTAEPLTDLFEEPPASMIPAEATVLPRASSFTDFHHVVHSRAKPAVAAEVTGGMDFHGLGEKVGFRHFEELYAEYEDEILDSSAEEYRLYHEQLTLSERHLDGLLEDTNASLDLLATLSESFKAVEAQTTAFQAQCEDLLAEQKRLKQLSDEVGDSLQYYAYLEPITRRLNAPGALRFAGNEDFTELITNLCSCIEFMSNRSEHRESELYLTRYASLLDRALNLARVRFDTIVSESSAELEPHLTEKTLTSTLLDHHALKLGQRLRDEMGPYIKTLAELVAGLGGQKPAKVYVSKLQANFLDHVNTTITQRNRFVLPQLEGEYAIEQEKFITEEQLKSHFLTYARAMVNATLDVGTREKLLLLDIFDSTATAHFLNGPPKDRPLVGIPELPPTVPLARSFTDQPFEPLIATQSQALIKALRDHLAKQELAIAVELATYLSNKFSDFEFDTPDVRDRETATRRIAEYHFETRIIHNCLVYVTTVCQHKIQSLTSELITNYVGKSSTGNSNNLVVSNEDFEKHFGREMFSSLREDFKGAYAPVKTAMQLLVLTKDLIDADPTNQHKLSKECCEIIKNTTGAITTARPFSTPAENAAKPLAAVDAKIFVVKNLLLLKNVVQAYEIPTSTTSTALDLTDLWQTFSELRERGELFSLSAYWKLVGSGKLMPRVVETVSDAKEQLDGELRKTIKELTDVARTAPVLKADKVRGKLAKAFERSVADALLVEIGRSGEK